MTTVSYTLKYKYQLLTDSVTKYQNTLHPYQEQFTGDSSRGGRQAVAYSRRLDWYPGPSYQRRRDNEPTSIRAESLS